MKNLLLAILVCASTVVRAAAPDTVSVIEQVRLSQEEAAAGHLEEALSLARKAVGQDPAYGAAWRQLGILLVRAGSRPEALEAFETATKLSPDDAALWRDYGWTLWAENRRPEALEAFEKAVAQGLPQKEDLAIQVLAALSEQGRPEEALTIFERWMPGVGVLDPAVKLVEKGRTLAARPLLERAWRTGEKPAISGLYLAYVNAVNGTCLNAYEQLDPFLKELSGDTDVTRLNMALETLYACSDSAQLQDAVARVEKALKGRSAADDRITDILEKAAEEQRFRRDPRRALELYTRALTRDPNRVSWVYAADLFRSLDGDEAALAFMNSLLEKSKAPAVRNGILARLADHAGDYGEAARLFALSLSAEPKQPQLRENYFKTLVRLGRIEDAQAEAEWFSARIAAGDPVLRSYLAEMWSSLGEDEKALDLWQMLHLSAPDLPYYALETARSLFRLCDPQGAVTVLESAGSLADYPLAHEFLAEIESSLGRADEAVKRAEAGLQTKPTRGLLRQHAENAEIAGVVSETSLSSSAAFLEQEPGNASVALLHGRQLLALGQTNEASAWFQALVERNPAMIPALLALKDAATLNGEFQKAAEYARDAATVIPSHVDATRRYALALGENERWHRALRKLRSVAAQDPLQAIPVLAYRLVTDCPYPGRNNVDQVRAHVTRLAAEGFTFVLPGELEPEGAERRVMIVLLDADRRVVEEVDRVLEQSGARAVYAGTTATLTRNVPNKPSPEALVRLAESGRWAVASSGPEDNAPRPVKDGNITGNPLTHRLLIQGEPEEKSSFSSRIDNVLASCAASLSENAPRLLVYPGGDFGQLSLDTDPETVAALRAAVERHFDYGLYFEDPGFITPRRDNARLPARIDPPDWDAPRLMDHVLRGHPITRAQLDLAKLLYWNRQHEAANVWFKRASKSGADPAEIDYNWGANAYQQGDLPTALRKLRSAAESDPGSDRTRLALERAEEQRSPELSIFAHGWSDNEDRSYLQWGGEANVFAVDRVRLGLFADQNRWERDGDGSEEGLRGGVQGLLYLDRAAWIDVRFWRLQMDEELPDVDGRQLTLRLPNTLLSGHVELIAAREEMETLEALRADIQQTRYAARTYSRLLDVFDLYANLSRLERTDENDTTLVDGRLVYRAKEWPFLGLGYLFRFGDSDFDPPEYWAPRQLEQHQLYGNLRGAYGRFSFSLSGQAGYAKELDTQWRFVWGARAQADLRLNKHLSARAEASYFEGPVYERTTWTLGAAARF